LGYIKERWGMAEITSIINGPYVFESGYLKEKFNIEK
jgi:hypothetical protein